MAFNYLNDKTTPRARIEIKEFGQWNEAIREIQRLGPAIKEASIKSQVAVLNDIKKIVKGHLRDQDLGWSSLDADYAGRKQRAGMSGKTLIAYGIYKNSIKVWRKGNQHMVFMGVRRGVYTREFTGKRSRIEVAEIAYIHEFSSGKRIPRRPLWNPSIADYGGAGGIKKSYIKNLHKYLRMAGLKHINYKYTLNSVFR